MADPVLVSYCRTCLRLLHFAGLVLGFGGAVFVDLLFVRLGKNDLAAGHVDIVEWASGFIALGLGLLWISGLGFLALYQLAEPEKLFNSKIWAKMTIVAVLTVNGGVIHRSVLPFLRQRIGHPLLEGAGTRTRTMLIGCGVISMTSWIAPVLLGAAPQLNFVVPYAAIIAAYGLSLLATFLIASIAMREQRPDWGQRVFRLGRQSR